SGARTKLRLALEAAKRAKRTRESAPGRIEDPVSYGGGIELDAKSLASAETKCVQATGDRPEGVRGPRDDAATVHAARHLASELRDLEASVEGVDLTDLVPRARHERLLVVLDDDRSQTRSDTRSGIGAQRIEPRRVGARGCRCIEPVLC